MIGLFTNYTGNFEIIVFDTEEQAREQMFNILVDKRFCEPTDEPLLAIAKYQENLARDDWFHLFPVTKVDRPVEKYFMQNRYF